MIRLGICNELFEGWDFGRGLPDGQGARLRRPGDRPVHPRPEDHRRHPGRRRELRAMVEDAGLATIGLHWLLAKTEGFYLTTPDAAVRRRTADYLVALAEATRDLGGDADGPRLAQAARPAAGRDLRPGDRLRRRGLRAGSCPTLGDFGVDLCLEPLAPSETNFLNTCDQADALIARVGHPQLQAPHGREGPEQRDRPGPSPS